MRIKSSMLKTMTYDKKERTLDVTFRNGSSYQYTEIGKTPVSRVLKAASKGRAFHKHIRDKYPTEKLEAAPKKKGK